MRTPAADRQSLAGLDARMAASRSDCALWCGQKGHSAYVGARPCDTRDGCIAQRLELRVSHRSPHPEPRGKTLPLLTQEGSLRAMTFQAAPADRALGSGKRMVSSGHMVVFDDDCSHVLNKMTG